MEKPPVRPAGRRRPRRPRQLHRRRHARGGCSTPCATRTRCTGSPRRPPNSGFWAVTRHADIARVDRDAETFTSTKFVNLEEVDDDQIKKRASILETGRRAPPRAAQPDPAPVRRERHQQLHRLPARPDRHHPRRGARQGRRSTSSRRSPPTSPSTSWPASSTCRRRTTSSSSTGATAIIGNTDPDYADVLLHSAESEQYRTCPSAPPPRWRSSSTAASWPASGAAATAPTWSSRLVNTTPRTACRCPRRTSTTTSCCSWSPATRPPATPSPTRCWPCSSTPSSSPGSRTTPSLIPDAVEEFLRWASPVYHFRRTATRDVELGGKQIKEGDKVVMWYASGNRDEEVFEQPLRLRRHPHGQRPRHLRQGQPAPVPGQPPGPHRDPHSCSRSCIPRLADIRLDRRRPARPLQLRQRHQEAAGRGHHPLTPPPGPHEAPPP